MKEMQVTMYVSDDGKVKDTNKKEVEDYELRNKVVELLPRKEIFLDELFDIIGDYLEVRAEIYKLDSKYKFNNLCKYFKYKTICSKYNPNCKFYIIDSSGIYSMSDYIEKQAKDKNENLDILINKYQENIKVLNDAVEQLDKEGN